VRIMIATVQVPFVGGGAESHAQGLRRALEARGHEADVVTLPFWREPPGELNHLLDAWARVRPRNWWITPDRVIALKFPAYLCDFADVRIWLLHQHREAYDLLETTRYERDAAFRATTDRVRALDREVLGRAAREGRLFTNSGNVSKRLARDSGIVAPPLYHPPPSAGLLWTAEAQPVIFAPSRLEAIKRQDLLIDAFTHVRSPVSAVITGGGTMQAEYERRIAERGLGDRVRMLGNVSREELLAWYAHALAVYFAPLDEDYGYVTLEAMLAAKPVITCTDSGGPLEFVEEGVTGLIREPDARALADAIDSLWDARQSARRMGEAGRESYRAREISWEKCMERLGC
jgi:glycosyltransferase involved in cell wall biosynthesis